MSETPARMDKGRIMLRRAKPAAEDAQELPAPWPVLVVDDEADIHAMTRVLLRDLTFQGRGFEVVSAYSAAEARDILAERPDIPVALLDVVMETADAGLALVEHIRRDLGNNRLAIVLRTGQPGEAPEREVMLAYDINDYRGKTELTAQNLVDTLPQPVWYKDASGDLRLYNRAFRDLFQFPEGQSRLPPQLEDLDQRADKLVLAEGMGSIALEANLEIGDQQRTAMI
ncbi:MAG: response regulator, partial [Rhodospirillaceae bacterium]|nr:response regulator [Rhodospirillaceae bacterium]